MLLKKLRAKLLLKLPMPMHLLSLLSFPLNLLASLTLLMKNALKLKEKRLFFNKSWMNFYKIKSK